MHKCNLATKQQQKIFPPHTHHISLSQLSIDGHLSCFYVLAIRNSAVVHTAGFCVSFQIGILIFSMYIHPGVGLLAHINHHLFISCMTVNFQLIVLLALLNW